MNLSICPRIYRGVNGQRETIADCFDFCASVGFLQFDFGISSRVGSCFLYGEDWETQAKRLAEFASERGYVIGQSHAPYAYAMYPDRAFYREMTRRSFEIAHILGAWYIVIHAELRDDPHEEYDHDKALQRAYEFYAPFAEQASRLGIGMAVENLFDFKRRWNFTATVEEQIEIIDRLNDPCVSACWDVGHGHVMYGEEHLSEMKKLGARLTCTHIHDNMQKRDLHLPPCFGDIRWGDVTAALREMQYRGDFNLELKCSHLPEALMTDYLRLVYNTARRITEEM